MRSIQISRSGCGERFDIEYFWSVQLFKTSHRPDFSRRLASLSQRPERYRLVPLRKPFAAVVRRQAVVVVVGSGVAEQGLEQAMEVGGVEQVLPTGYQRHALQGVIHRNTQMVTGRNILPGEHDVAEDFGGGNDLSGSNVVPGKRPGQVNGACHVEPDG